MVLPILVVEESELALWCMPEPPELPAPPNSPASRRMRANSREDLISQWRSVLSESIPDHAERDGTPDTSNAGMSKAMAGGDASELLRDGERLARLLLRRSWLSLPRRERRALRQRIRTFNLQAPAIRVPRAQTNATAWLLATMYWNGCRHPSALWCEPLHPATGVVRWLSGFDVVEQNEYPRDIMAQLAARVGWIESESRRLVKAMRMSRRVVALLPELLQ